MNRHPWPWHWDASPQGWTGNTFGPISEGESAKRAKREASAEERAAQAMLREAKQAEGARRLIKAVGVK